MLSFEKLRMAMAWQHEKKRKRLVVAGVALVVVVVVVVVAGASVGASRRSSRDKFPSFEDNYDITWASDHVRQANNGRVVELMLDEVSGAGFGSKNRYLFGHLGMQIRLVQNDSAGTVTAFFMSSLTDDRDEFNFQFLGNSTGQPILLQTNIFVNGVGGREQRMLLWFDPAADFHSYSILWNERQVVFLVDDIPIRVFKNNTASGIPYAYSKPVGIYSGIWNGGDTSRDRINWAHAPFYVSYRGFAIDACEYSGAADECHGGKQWWQTQPMWDAAQQSNLTSLKRQFIVYDYCTAAVAAPPECQLNGY